MLGKLVVDGTPKDSVPFDNPDERNLVEEVSMKVTPRLDQEHRLEVKCSR